LLDPLGMALTIQQAIEEMRHELGGPTHRRLPELEVLNRTGQWLFGARKWRFLQRPPTSLGVVSGQGYVDLPDDCGTIDKLVVAGRFDLPCHPASQSTVIEAREQGWTGIFQYAVSWIDAVDEASMARPVLLVAPIPTATSTSFFTLAYTADWVDIRDVSKQGTLTGSRGRFPTYMEPLFVEALRAMAAGYERRSGGSPTERLTAIQSGALWAAAVSRDVRQQRSYGMTIKPVASLSPDWYSGSALPPS